MPSNHSQSAKVKQVRCSLQNPQFAEIDQAGVGRVLEPRVPLQFSGSPVADAMAAPMLGGDIDAAVKDRLKR
ncbi:hypothetical protein PGC08_01590 [Brevibacterium sp. BDJS002]|uniref:hypothetical protein n=1 Tax=Brevibacterium sp. BDJS002 TaxID=3020906 RepID=UPI0023072599|nr:hypothetical protein [Brevibacterium sp. BDJS002]WCE40418.1 hypothetical protein PGC08_01590 [Brevibacterium sp. BDJS002]